MLACRHGASSVSPQSLAGNLLARFGGISTTERHISALGRDKVDHARGSHDDVANAAAGALVLCRDEVSHSGFAITMKLQETYRKWARSVA